MENDFFKFNLDGTDYNGYTTTGKFIFKDRDNILKKHKYLPFFILYYIVQYNIDDLEFFFRLMGFSAFKLDELPDFIINPTIINLPVPQNVNEYTNGMNLDEAKVFKYIEDVLGIGIIEKYFEIKKAQLKCKKNILLQQISHLKNEDENIIYIERDILKIKENNK